MRLLRVIQVSLFALVLCWGGCDDTGEGASTFDGSAPTTDLPTGVTRLSLMQTIDGAEVARNYILHTPSTLASGQNYPVVFRLHGANQTPEPFIEDLETLVEAGRFVGVYPEGYSQLWNISNTESTADDVAFIRAIINALGAYRQLDLNRMFAFGTSNGAGLSHKLAIETGLFRAIATEISQLHIGGEPNSDTTPVSVMQILGMRDPIVPYAGGMGPMTLNFYPGEESAEIWAQAMACNTPGTTDDNMTRIKISYDGCSNGVRVVHYGYKMLEHNAPPDIDGVPYNEAVIRFFESAP